METIQHATFGAGCFWCTEAVFNQLKGVINVIPGYAGGSIDNPTYEQVCDGNTGHAEVAQITFDPTQISYEQLLTVFFVTHDPTSLNRQGNDVGTQYRSVIFYENDEQKQTAYTVKQKLETDHVFSAPIVTEIAPLTKFYAAEDYHHNYYEKNSYQPYCQFVIEPKVAKVRKEFVELLKKS